MRKGGDPNFGGANADFVSLQGLLPPRRGGCFLVAMYTVPVSTDVPMRFVGVDGVSKELAVRRSPFGQGLDAAGGADRWALRLASLFVTNIKFLNPCIDTVPFL